MSGTSGARRTIDAVHRPDAAKGRPRIRMRPWKIVAEVFMFSCAVLWLLPVLFALYVSLRPITETNKLGYVSLPKSLTFQNYIEAWQQSNILTYFINSVLITLPGVVITLFLASGVAFVITRINFKLNIALLMLFTAGNLLPQQVIITPLYRLYLAIPLPEFLSASGTMYNSITGLIVINVTFQVGFCVFVLSNYMRTIPQEMYDAALVDGASLWTRYWSLTLPTIRPALAALATLLTTWIYNDFFWAITLISTGKRRPITSALTDLQGEFVANQNMIAAAALMAAIPTLIIFIVLQKQFIAGLTLGSTKG
ncbi:carbohydrate ABC transporter permease [Parafrigoribacterium mesophilum]|uniref:carbohydrate ABC transporter permease n=1 Tax=Parafrigoribacterium mesophilum TaxID=433646 RepID=UPI0031FC0732